MGVPRRHGREDRQNRTDPAASLHQELLDASNRSGLEIGSDFPGDVSACRKSGSKATPISVHRPANTQSTGAFLSRSARAWRGNSISWRCPPPDYAAQPNVGLDSPWNRRTCTAFCG